MHLFNSEFIFSVCHTAITRTKLHVLSRHTEGSPGLRRVLSTLQPQAAWYLCLTCWCMGMHGHG